ncbi:MAG: hypothetical protein GY820_05525 [Gammaproteobacteria bacterium]|nr:hypothetical protein [Gammaproteobacteria bacterium]
MAVGTTAVYAMLRAQCILSVNDGKGGWGAFTPLPKGRHLAGLVKRFHQRTAVHQVTKSPRTKRVEEKPYCITLIFHHIGG